jgi:hypothetical protein
MAITVTCACGQGFRVKDDLAGKNIKCPKCGQALAIPDPQSAGGELSLDDLMKLDAGAPTMPGLGGLPAQPEPAPGPQAQVPVGGGFQSPAFPFGQAAGPAKSSSSSGSNKKVLILCAVGGFALLAIGGIVLMLVMGTDKPAATVADSSTSAVSAQPTPPPGSSATPGATATARKPLALSALTPVKLEAGGRASVELRVERNGAEGPIQIQIANVPQGLAASAAEIPAGQSLGRLDLVVSDMLAAGEIGGTLEITIAVGQAQAKQSLAVSVTKPNLPTFEPVADVFVQPGGSASVRLVLRRNGYVGPLEVRPEGISDKVSLRAEDIAAGKIETKLEIAAAADTPEATHSLRVTGLAQEQQFSLTIPLHIANAPFRVKSLAVVTMKPGEEKSVRVVLERRTYKGPVRLTAESLPEGVTIPAVEIAAGQSEAMVKLIATPEATECIRTTKVIASADNLSTGDALLVRVTRGETGFLPREVTANKELFGLLRKGSFGGRLTTESKQALLDAYGGTAESENAVLMGLRWLAAHQQSDGRWSLKSYNQGIPNCDCRKGFEEKVQDNDTAGTAFGLLPFLGAGVTQNRSPSEPAELAKYQRVVRDGIKFLVKNQVVTGKDVKKIGNLGGTMYSHALGTMALCEAYGLSGDDELRVPAQRAVRYLLDSQHGEGGWRYGPNQPGDMSVTGWVFLAIRDGQLATIPVGDEPIKKAEKFLDLVADGPPEAKLSRYCYEPGKPATLTLTAAGLLARQYTGWQREEPDLVAGCKYMMQHLPPENAKALGSMYFYYYATQVLHHMEGQEFDLWNYRMREHLIRTQQQSGHRAGSWEPEGCDHGATGGRLYATSLALLTLQVYYRHLPLYRSLTQTKTASK